MTLVLGSISRLAIAVGLTLSVGAAAIGCGAADGAIGVTEERDLGGFIIPNSTSTPQDLAVAPGTVVDLSMSSTTLPPATSDLSMPSSGCGSIDTNGICNGNTLEYCSSSNKLVTKDCSTSSKVCSVSSSGYANCTDS